MKHSNNWNGGKWVENGYVNVWKPKHPLASGGYVLEHRLVMEKHLGRYLTKDEVVHHKNGIRNDNRIENLELMTKSEHGRLHETGNIQPESTKLKISIGMKEVWEKRNDEKRIAISKKIWVVRRSHQK